MNFEEFTTLLWHSDRVDRDHPLIIAWSITQEWTYIGDLRHNPATFVYTCQLNVNQSIKQLILRNQLLLQSKLVAYKRFVHLNTKYCCTDELRLRNNNIRWNEWSEGNYAKTSRLRLFSPLFPPPHLAFLSLFLFLGAAHLSRCPPRSPFWSCGSCSRCLYKAALCFSSAFLNV